MTGAERTRSPSLPPSHLPTFHPLPSVGGKNISVIKYLNSLIEAVFENIRKFPGWKKAVGSLDRSLFYKQNTEVSLYLVMELDHILVAYRGFLDLIEF